MGNGDAGESTGAKLSLEEAVDKAFESEEHEEPDETPVARGDGEESDEADHEDEPTPKKQASEASEQASEVKALRQELADLKRQLSRVNEPEDDSDSEDEDFDYEVAVPEGWDDIKGTFQDVGKRAEKRVRETEKRIASVENRLVKTLAQMDVKLFQRDHKDWKDYQDDMVTVAEEEGIRVSDYDGLERLYNRIRDKRELLKLREEREAGKKAGPVHRFQQTRQATRESRPGDRLLSLSEALNAAVEDHASGRVRPLPARKARRAG